MATEASPHFLMLYQYELEFSPLVCLAELVCQRVEVIVLERFYAHEFYLYSLSFTAAAVHMVIGQVPKGIGARQGRLHPDSLHNTALSSH